MRPEPPARPYVSVIIPTFQEAGALADTIASVFCPAIEAEIIVVDAASSDGTPQIAERAGCRVIAEAPRQRAAQMNLGARAAAGDVLLFLHADTRLPSGALLAIREALRDPRVPGGAFARRYDSPSRVLAVTCQLAALRNRWLGWHLGDQAMFVRSQVFHRCGGFVEVDRFEDLDFSRRLGRCGPLATLRPPVISSARRFVKRGPILGTLRDVFLTCRYLAYGLGTQPVPSQPASPYPIAPRPPPRAHPFVKKLFSARQSRS